MKSFLAIFVLVCGFFIAAAVLIAAAFWLHVVLGFVAFCLIGAGVARGLDSLLADDRPEPVEEWCAPEGEVRR